MQLGVEMQLHRSRGEADESDIRESSSDPADAGSVGHEGRSPQHCGEISGRLPASSWRQGVSRPRRSLAMNAQNRMFGCRDGAVIHVRVEGRAAAHQCAELKRFVCEAIDEGARDLRIDLADCTYADSTFVGTLLQLRKRAAAEAEGRVTLEGPNPAMQKILTGMGVSRMFAVQPLADESLPHAWSMLEGEEAGLCSRAFKENVLAAHTELAAASDICRERYAPIIEAAALELEQTTLVLPIAST
jgi:anti-anti-sigma factor